MSFLNDPLHWFVFLGLFSPGPNVILLTASGARWGFKRTLPHLLGVVLGVGIIAGLTAFGLGSILIALPKLAIFLKVIAALWILWLAWKLWFSKPMEGGSSDAPMTFVQALFFQWVNPKIWAVALTGITLYSAGLPPIGEAARLGTAFSGINLFVCLFWTYAGSLLTFLLKSAFAWRVFMRVMALALAAFSIMVLI